MDSDIWFLLGVYWRGIQSMAFSVWIATHLQKLVSGHDHTAYRPSMSDVVLMLSRCYCFDTRREITEAEARYISEVSKYHE
ncbi:hypothetical protein H5410_013849 [Solanum commersonii]|uniref:Uncharacterized protein n=1 Tax=Solanum commersonii TaxID=4109 RepID=A0A9J5ZPD0_SOLCO|nr:hypothetical protein H5410_013849 [Solanum commersonii]